MSIDFRKHLSRQLAFLQNSCDLYDQGFEDEAIRIATVARVLFHHTHHPIRRRNGSVSLLQHLGAKNVRLLSTCPQDPRAAALGGFQMNLTLLVASWETGEFGMVPKLDRSNDVRTVPFFTWWERQKVYSFRFKGQRMKISRKQLVCIAANQDGGAHVDAQLDSQYKALQQGGELSFHGPNLSSPRYIGNAHLAALRQIGYEIINSPDITGLQ